MTSSSRALARLGDVTHLVRVAKSSVSCKAKDGRWEYGENEHSSMKGSCERLVRIGMKRCGSGRSCSNRYFVNVAGDRWRFVGAVSV